MRLLLMKYNVWFGRYPFNHKIGQVEAPDNHPEIALYNAKELYRGVVPEGVVLDKGERSHFHPVISIKE
jgi:hypothetical protein